MCKYFRFIDARILNRVALCFPFRFQRKKTRWWSRSSTGCWRRPPTSATSWTSTSSTTSRFHWARRWRWSSSKNHTDLLGALGLSSVRQCITAEISGSLTETISFQLVKNYYKRIKILQWKMFDVVQRIHLLITTLFGFFLTLNRNMFSDFDSKSTQICFSFIY